MTPTDKLAAREQEIFAAREPKLEGARQQRLSKRRAATAIAVAVKEKPQNADLTTQTAAARVAASREPEAGPAEQQSGRNVSTNERWESCPALDSIRERADALMEATGALPPRVTARRLAMWLGFSKTPVLRWIKNQNLIAIRQARRLFVPKEEIYTLIDAANFALPYERHRRMPFGKLRKSRQKIELPKQKTFTPKEIAAVFSCSATTVKRAVFCGKLQLRRRPWNRWAVKAEDLRGSPVFGRLIRMPPARPQPLVVRLPTGEFFSTAKTAKILQVSQQTVRNLIRRRQLEAESLGPRKVMVKRASLRSFLKTRPQ